MTKKQEESWIPVTDYEAIMEHALVMAHQLEQVLPFIPMDSELYHRVAVELSQYSGWIKKRLDPFVLQSRQQLKKQIQVNLDEQSS